MSGAKDTGAGKGPQPRKVRGDAFRESYDRIFRKRKFADCDCEEQVPSNYGCEKCEEGIHICAECMTVIAGRRRSAVQPIFWRGSLIRC